MSKVPHFDHAIRRANKHDGSIVNLELAALLGIVDLATLRLRSLRVLDHLLVPSRGEFADFRLFILLINTTGGTVRALGL